MPEPQKPTLTEIVAVLRHAAHECFCEPDPPFDANRERAGYLAFAVGAALSKLTELAEAEQRAGAAPQDAPPTTLSPN